MPSKKVRAKLKKQNADQNTQQTSQQNKSNNLSSFKGMQSIANKIKPMYDKLGSTKKSAMEKFTEMIEFLNNTQLTLPELKEIETKMNYKTKDDAYVESNLSLLKNIPQDTVSDLQNIGKLWSESDTNPAAYLQLDEYHIKITPIFLKIHMELAGRWITYMKKYKEFRNTVVEIAESINPAASAASN